MNHLKLWIVAALAAALALSMFASVSAQPRPPLVFRGTVTGVDGNPAPTGLDVQAYVNGVDCTEKATTTFPMSGGKTGYFVRVAKSSQTDGCAENGDTVRFRIGNYSAIQTGTFDGTKAIVTLNLTLTDVASAVNIGVAVWRRVEDPFNAFADLFISTKAPGETWDTHDDDGPLNMSISGSGRFYRSDLTPVAVKLRDGTPVTINVAVWRRVSDPTLLYISTQAPGEDWVTDNTALDMSDLSGSGRFNRSDLRTVVVELQ